MTGKLIYVVGPSGAGKDSIMNMAKKKLGEDGNIVFAKRFITRRAESSEDHVSLSGEQFMFMEACGAFLFHWYSHGLHYGVSITVKDDIAAGKTLIMNGSREYLPKALNIFPALKVIYITASRDILELRLLERGRESLPDVKQRLQPLSFTLPKDTFVIDNSGELKAAAEQFIKHVKRLNCCYDIYKTSTIKCDMVL